MSDNVGSFSVCNTLYFADIFKNSAFSNRIKLLVVDESHCIKNGKKEYFFTFNHPFNYSLNAIINIHYIDF